MKTIVFALALATTQILQPQAAVAASDSLLTLGVGTSMSVGGESSDALSGSVRTRLRLLLGLGAELTYQPAGAGSDVATTGAHGLLYLLPTSPVGGYVKAGLTNQRFGEFGTDEDRYDVGGGLEVYLGEHVVVGAEYLRAFPNVDQLAQSVADGESAWGTGANIWSLTIWWFT